MARHAARLPTRRRTLAALLGSATVISLAMVLWLLGRPDTGAELALSTTIPSVTTPPTTPPTTRVPSTTVTTASSTTAPPSTTAATQPPTTDTTLAPLVLEADGLGPIPFGTPPEETIAAITARLGPADSDSGWVGARGNFGTCPGSIVRVVRWDSLRAFFSDGPTDFGEETQHFFYYSQSTVDTTVLIDLTTGAGIGIGASVSELQDAYGNGLSIESSSPFGVTFTVRMAGPGLLSGTLTESVPEGEVTSVAGGFGCGA